jgi:hypothetical protein
MTDGEDVPGRAGATPRPHAGRDAVVSVVLGWLLPGLGHLFLGRYRRGLLYSFLILFMFGFGLWLEGSLSRPLPGSLLSKLATVADMGVGPLYWVAWAAGWASGRVAAATHELGNTFHWSAGVLNMLLLLDAHDIALGRK